MESEGRKFSRAEARRRRREPQSAEWGKVPESGDQKGRRNLFYIAGGCLIVALVAFLCGIQIGKSVGELSVSEETPRVQDAKGKAPPFRFLEKGKENKPEPKPPEPADAAKEKEPPPVQAPAEPPKDPVVPEKKPGEERAANSKAKYAIQVAAFNSQGEAQDLVSQLKKKGYEAYQVTGTAAARGMLHRVRIGRFHSLQEARQFAADFEKKENLKPIITSGTP